MPNRATARPADLDPQIHVDPLNNLLETQITKAEYLANQPTTTWREVAEIIASIWSIITFPGRLAFAIANGILTISTTSLLIVILLYFSGIIPNETVATFIDEASGRLLDLATRVNQKPHIKSMWSDHDNADRMKRAPIVNDPGLGAADETGATTDRNDN